jgi:colicin import membrane protein
VKPSTSPAYLEFSPPATHGTPRALGFALFVHALLLIALTAGIQWQKDIAPTFQAELFATVPVAAAPKAVEVPPEPEEPPSQPTPAPVVKPAPEPVQNKDADIAIAKRKKEEERKQKEAEKLRLEELRKQEEAKKVAEEKRKLEAQREQEKKEKELKEKELQKQKEQKQKDLKEKERKEKELQDKDAQKKKDAEDAKKLEALRKDNLKRMKGLANASGDSSATGTALKSAGPSDSYGGRIQAALYPKITFSGDPSIPYTVDVEVKCAPNGSIVGTPRVVKPSASNAWDDAVTKAFIKLETLPRDKDGSVHCPLIVTVNQKRI